MQLFDGIINHGILIGKFRPLADGALEFLENVTDQVFGGAGHGLSEYWAS